MQIRVLMCSVVLSSICIGQTGTTSPAPPQAGAPSSASKGAITFDLVLTLKALGDEYFIAGDRGAASTAYTRAQNELKALDPKATSYPTVKIDLATKELEYRQLLLSRGYDFWGTGVDSGPISPRAHLAEMKVQLDGLKETATLIGTKIDAIATDTTTSSNIKALEAAVDGQIGKTQIEDQKAEQVQDYAAARIDELGARLRQIRTEQDRNATIAQQANEKLKQLENSTNGLILSQVTQLAGLPIDVGAFASGDVKSQVKAIGLSLLSNKSSKFHDSLESLSGQAAKIGDLVKRAEDLKKQVEQGQVLIAHVSDVLRKPTVEGLLTAGQEVMAQLPPEVQQSLVQQIKDSKPLLPLVELARSRPDVRKAVLIAANQAGVNLASFEQITSTVAGRHRSEMLTWYKDVLARTAAASPASVEPILSAYMRLWPQQFVDQLPGEVRSAVFKALKVATAEEFANRFKNFPETHVTVSEGRLYIEGVDTGTRLASLISRIDVEQTLQDYDRALQQEVQGTVRELQRKVGSLDQVVSDALPQSILEDGIAKAVGAKTASFDTILGGISDPARQKQIFTDLASESVAAIASSAVLRDPATPFRSSKRDFSDVAGTVGKQAPASATPNQNQMMGSLAIGVLGKAVPAVAAAQAVAQIVGNLFEMGAQFDKISEANSEIKRLMIEEVHVQDILEESRLNHALALYDREIAQLGTRVAFEERDLYRVGLRNQASKMKQAQAEALYQSEILFYRAEMLRREFDALDNTLALWLGPKDGIRGQITARISDNPQYVRLALDPQINLFAWLDRDIESQRDDISTLRTHWEEVYELSRQVCLAVGCAEGSQNLPDVQTTAVLQLSKVVSPAVWQAFQEWQKSGGQESFSFWILMRPSTGIISIKHENARIVDLRLAAQRNGAEETLHSFDLYHPGVSYIPYRGTIHVDVLKPDHISSALKPSTLGDTTIRNLKEAWIAKDAPPPASRFAGYGMFTEWRLTLEPDQLNKSLNEVVLQIAYRYTPAQADATSEAGESFILRPVGTDLTIEGSTLNALGGQKQLQDKLLRWRSSRETNIPSLSFAAEIEGHL